MSQAVDSGEYAATEREFAVARVTPAQVQSMLNQHCPLGFAPRDWHRFQVGLCDALIQDGLSGADVRLQGSSARFFSFNLEKRFPQDVAAVHADAAHEKLPPAEVEARWRQFGYDRPGPLPNAHFFDSRRYLLFNDRRIDSRVGDRSVSNISPDASDYDLQIASDPLAAKIVAWLRRKHRNDDDFARELARCRSQHGGHFRQSLLRYACPKLVGWAQDWTVELKRSVNLAAFPASGPQGQSAFKEGDWTIPCPPPPPPGPRSLAREPRSGTA